MTEPEWIGALRYDRRRDYRWLWRIVHGEYQSTTQKELNRTAKPGQAGLYDGKRKVTTR